MKKNRVIINTCFNSVCACELISLTELSNTIINIISCLMKYKLCNWMVHSKDIALSINCPPNTSIFSPCALGSNFVWNVALVLIWFADSGQQVFHPVPRDVSLMVRCHHNLNWLSYCWHGAVLSPEIWIQSPASWVSTAQPVLTPAAAKPHGKETHPGMSLLSLQPVSHHSSTDRRSCCWQHQKMAVGSWWGCLIFWAIWDLLIIKHMSIHSLLFFELSFITAISIHFLNYSSNFSLTSWFITPSGVIMETLCTAAWLAATNR